MRHQIAPGVHRLTHTPPTTTSASSATSGFKVTSISLLPLTVFSELSKPIKENTSTSDSFGAGIFSVNLPSTSDTVLSSVAFNETVTPGNGDWSSSATIVPRTVLLFKVSVRGTSFCLLVFLKEIISIPVDFLAAPSASFGLSSNVRPNTDSGKNLWRGWGRLSENDFNWSFRKRPQVGSFRFLK